MANTDSPKRYYMATPYADCTPECRGEHMVDRTCVFELNREMFYGHAWGDVIPLPFYISIMNTLLFLTESTMQIGTVPIFIEEVHAPPDHWNEDGAVVGFRFWVLLNVHIVPEFTGIISDILARRAENRQNAKRPRLESVPESPKLLSELNIRSPNDIALAFQYAYPNLAVSGDVREFDLMGDGNMSLMSLLSMDGIFAETVAARHADGKVCALQADLEAYCSMSSEDPRFRFPQELIDRGWVRQSFFKRADAMLEYMLPYVQAPEELVREKLETLDPDRTEKSKVPLWEMLPCEYPAPADAPPGTYTGSVFGSALQRYHRIEVPPPTTDDHTKRMMAQLKPIHYNISTDITGLFDRVTKRARLEGDRGSGIKMVADACAAAADAYRKVAQTGTEIPRYHLQLTDATQRLKRLRDKASDVDAKASRLFYPAERDRSFTPISEMLHKITELLPSLSLKEHQIDAFFISFLLCVNVMKNDIGPQSFVFLLGPPECGKSFTLQRATEMFNAGMQVRPFSAAVSFAGRGSPPAFAPGGDRPRVAAGGDVQQRQQPGHDHHDHGRGRGGHHPQGLEDRRRQGRRGAEALQLGVL